MLLRKLIPLLLFPCVALGQLATNNGVANQTITALSTTAGSPSAHVAGGGTAHAQTVTLVPAATALTAGLEVRWKPTAANTGAAPTLAVNGLTATAITKFGATALVANDLTATAIASDSPGADGRIPIFYLEN
jgi:hypothetical protein